MFNHDNNEQEANSLFERAADWFVKCERGLSPDENAQLERELERDPKLQDELDAFFESQQLAQGLSPDLANELLAEAQATSTVSTWWKHMGAMAALLILGIGLFFATHPIDQTTHTEELVATQQTQTHVLPDGSLIRLNSDTRVEVSYSEHERAIQLLSGEALFEVAKDKSRPFSVSIGEVKVLAVGTAFNIKFSDTIDVFVTEGIVSIDSPLLLAHDAVQAIESNVGPSSPLDRGKRVIQGQRAEVIHNENTKAVQLKVTTPDPQTVNQALRWQRSLLTIEAETLEQIAASFEQKTGYKLVIADPKLKQLQFGGRFPSDDALGFLKILNTGYGIPWKKGAEGEFIIGEPDAN
ncbi:FecR domain-containing protein [Pelagicoccus mobilis]|uniref:FecR domain-containing protein n=1 Tax=Pelagicoccus mobilis TaxID=415221 RepID=A0A934S0H2_9BACT|nr:FecR domain-containing protein [Pelagicoccus mobilis]MBK1877632.1 FecR domain-containing protein [Pelagicoccus mobilis]